MISIYSIVQKSQPRFIFGLIVIFWGIFLNVGARQAPKPDNETVEYQLIKKQIQTLARYDSVRFFKLASKAMRLAKDMESTAKQADVLQMIGTYYYFKRNFSRAEKFYQNAEILAEQANDLPMLNLIGVKKVFIILENGKIFEALQILDSLEKSALTIKDTLSLMVNYNAKAQIWELKSQKEKALKYYLKGKELAQAQKDKFYYSTFLNNLGSFYLSLGQYEDAMIEFENGLKIAEETEDKILTIQLNHNIGVVNINLGRFKEAESFYQKNILKAKALGFPRELGASYLNLGHVYHNLNQSDKALRYVDSSIINNTINNLNNELIEALLSKAQILLKLQRFSEALEIINKTENQVKGNGISYFLPGILQLKAQAHEKMGNYKDALFTYKNFTKVNDSLAALNNQQTINELKITHQVEQKVNELTKSKAELAVLKKESDYKRLFIYFLISVFLTILLTTFSVFYYFMARNKRIEKDNYTKKLIKEIDEERSRIAKDLHDDIGQGLSVVKSMITQNTDKNKSIELMDQIIERMRGISRTIHPSSLKMLGLNATLEQLLKTTEQSTGLICSLESTPEIEELDIDIKTNVYRIFQECINNTIKYAHATALKIEIIKTNDCFNFTYRDNGKGLSDDFKSGMGFLNMKERVKMLKGQLNINNPAPENGIIIKFNCKN